MKRILIITGIFIAVVILLLAAIPLFFRQTLIEKTKTTINKNVNADVEFSDLKLSLLRNFPKFTLTLTDVLVTGKGEFQSDTLVSVPSLQARTSLYQLINKESIGIQEIILESPYLNLIVSGTGNVNWDIAIEGEPEPEEEETEAMELNLDHIEVQDAKFIYNDREVNMLLILEDINIGIAGKMYGTAASLRAEGKSDQVTLIYDSIRYISGVSIETNSLLDIDYETMDISIEENELFINRLPMEVTGMIKIPGDTMFFDMQLKTKESGFDNFLALIPPEYEEYLDNIETGGTAAIKGSIDGWYFEEEYPSVDLSLDVQGGSLHYEGLPEDIKNISADVSVTKPQGVFDLLGISVRKAHAEVKNNPVDMTLLLRNLLSDPYFDGTFTGNVNFNDLKDAIPLDSVNIAGIIDADIVVKGNYSSIENEQYNKITSEGSATLKDFVYESPQLTRQILIPGGRMEFTPRAVNLTGLNVKAGESDFNFEGYINDYLDYLLSNGTLSGNLDLTSRLVNMNELLRLQVDKKSTESQEDIDEDMEKEEEKLVFDVPGNINFTFNSKIEKVLFDNLQITDVTGLITVRNGKIELEGLNMNMLDGEMALTGSYENTQEDKPLFDFGLEMTKFDIPEAFRTIGGIRNMLPVAGHSQGKLSSILQVKGQLNPRLNLLSSTINGSGLISTESLNIIKSPVFNQLSGLLKPEILDSVKVQDFSANLEIVDGGIDLKPFNTKIAGQETIIKGNISAQNIVDMQMEFNVEREAFGNDIQNILNALPGEQNINSIPATVVIKGPVKDPAISINLEEARKKITEEVKKSTREDIQKSLNKLGEGLKKLF
jgi:uncharacterized protein involved in outer membrane biogenesis